MSSSELPSMVQEWMQGLDQEMTRIEAGQSARQWTYDMDDEAELSQPGIHELPRLKMALEFLQREVYLPWRAADQKAIALQNVHRWIAWWAISLGVAAVILAILQLMFKELLPAWTDMILIWEVASVILAAIAVALGISLHFHHRWLTQRQIAERLRGLKFESLGWHELWCDDGEWQRFVREEVQRLTHLNREQAEEWAMVEEEPWPEEIVTPTCPPDLVELAGVVRYYQTKRQRYQKWFFKRQSRTADNYAWGTRYKSSLWIFFASAIFVIGHGGVALWLGQLQPSKAATGSAASEIADAAAGHLGQSSDPTGGSDETKKLIDKLHRVETILIGLAALLPVFGFGLRAWTSAFEFPRSRNLYRAKLNAISDLMEKLRNCKGNANSTMHYIRLGELFLQGEHREWCRLQMEAEWYF